MTNQSEMLDLLKATALREGHFVLTSGRHSNRFMLFSHLTQHPDVLAKVCYEMARPFFDVEVDTVLGPAMGGVVLAYEVARQIGLHGKSRPRAIYTEKSDNGMSLRRGWTLRPGEKVLVVEDAVTTGGSVYKALDAVQALQPEVLAVTIIVDRSQGTVDFGVPLHAVLKLDIESWLPDDCPLCKDRVPLVKPKG